MKALRLFVITPLVSLFLSGQAIQTGALGAGDSILSQLPASVTSSSEHAEESPPDRSHPAPGGLTLYGRIEQLVKQKGASLPARLQKMTPIYDQNQAKPEEKPIEQDLLTTGSSHSLYGVPELASSLGDSVVRLARNESKLHVDLAYVNYQPEACA